MANFCYDCAKDILGVDPTWNDFARGRIRAIPEDEFWKVLCEGCGYIMVDNEGKKVKSWGQIIKNFPERTDEDE